jgi:transglutaminase-like putative cysteine protease
MLLSIQHKTELTYAGPITESVMELRMMPRTDASQTLKSFTLAVGPEAQIFEHSDWQGNRAHHFSIVEGHDKVVIVAASSVETHQRRLRLEELPDLLPNSEFGHRHHDFLMCHGAVQRDPRLARFAEQIGLISERRAGAVLAIVTMRLCELIEYRKGVTTSATTVADALDRGQGVCQDYAHVALSLLRMLGMPARYVSGYLFRSGGAELETHAWVEVYVPSSGWIGIDPTHRELASPAHVAVANGRSYADVPPNRGVYRGGAEERIAVHVQMHCLDAEAEAAPPITIPLPEVQVLPEKALREQRLDLKALEQQQQQQQQQ